MSKSAERKIENAVASATAKVIKAVGDKLSGKKTSSGTAKKLAKKKKASKAKNASR